MRKGLGFLLRRRIREKALDRYGLLQTWRRYFIGTKKSFRNSSKEEIIRGLEALLTCKLVTREAFSYPPQSLKI